MRHLTYTAAPADQRADTFEGLRGRRGAKGGVLIALACAAFVLTGCGSGAESEPDAALFEADTTDQSLQDRVPDDYKADGISVGVFDNWPPEEWRDADGQYRGFNVDLANLVSDKIGVEVEYTASSFDAILPAIKNGRFDVGLGSFQPTLERLKVASFVLVNVNGKALAIAEDSSLQIETHDDLCGHSVSTIKGSADIEHFKAISDECVADGHAPIAISEFTTLPSAREAVRSGRVDMVSASYTQLAHLLSSTSDMRGTPLISYSYYQGWAVRQDDPLGEVLSDAVDALIKDGSYAELLKKWNIERGGVESSRLFEDGATEQDVTAPEFETKR